MCGLEGDLRARPSPGNPMRLILWRISPRRAIDELEHIQRLASEIKCDMQSVDHTCSFSKSSDLFSWRYSTQ
jgi:hypothetical protein